MIPAQTDVPQFPSAHKSASVKQLFFGLFPVENKVNDPKPMPREKKICPAASIQTTGSFSFSNYQEKRNLGLDWDYRRLGK